MTETLTIPATIEFLQTAMLDPMGAPRIDRSGVPLWHHPVEVMLALPLTADHELKQIALLHDVLEDTDLAYDDLRDAGFGNRVSSAVVELTRDMSKSYWDYLDSINGIKAIIVKMADNRVNYGRSSGSLRDRYDRAAVILAQKATVLRLLR